ncbi:NAD(P)/FAD-dependent oxidoreductase [Kiloniella sp. b19]|uniref:NAD(P)/FAD-dependent oxidoreductase n=1 Tax=Kiloniella sp. GXU_MW_B19 TaxID=3141326 RepID=UPI0031D313B0
MPSEDKKKKSQNSASSHTTIDTDIAIIGGGPSGMMAALRLAERGYKVELFEARPSLARKFQLAGRGGLNITHSENVDRFLTRYGSEAALFANYLASFSPDNLRDFCGQMGEETFVGSSGRVFPEGFKATTLLRNWIRALSAAGVTLHTKHRWIDFDTSNNPVIQRADHSLCTIRAKATVLALGGGSWPRMGSDAKWIPLLREQGISITPLSPSNCGYHSHHASLFPKELCGQPLKNIALHLDDESVNGEVILTSYGLEGNALYALGRSVREKIAQEGMVTIFIDLKPALSLEKIIERLNKRPAKHSMTRHLKRELKLTESSISLLKVLTNQEDFTSSRRLASLIKRLPFSLSEPRPMEEAISTAGGVDFEECTEGLMLKKLPGVFVAGEMLNWDAPTGGYLLQGCISMGHYLAGTIDDYLKQH